MEDEKITDLYFARDEQAIYETKKKYFPYLKKIAMNVLSNDADAEECLNDTYLAMWNSIPPTRPDSLKAYAARLIRNFSIDIYRKKQTKATNTFYSCIGELDEAVFGEENTIDDYMDSVEFSEMINAFLAKLPQRERQIFVRRYFYVESIKEIAKFFAVKESVVKTSLHRSRIKLSNFMRKRGFTNIDAV